MGPQVVTLDGAGNLIRADISNAVLEKVTPAGTLSVMGGDGTVFPPLHRGGCRRGLRPEYQLERSFDQ
jgi:hypothetical protein